MTRPSALHHHNAQRETANPLPSRTASGPSAVGSGTGPPRITEPVGFGRAWKGDAFLAEQVDDIFSADDRVTVAFTLTCTHGRSGRDLTMTGVKSCRFRDGRIVEFWGETDLYGLLRPAGLVPERIPPF
ncbi:ester cyclase [Streptomyces pinistramenti]|uniref:ester cyclase n=1 Tax=Streptomyces pinistramenti TaxID=2884812 RepID=UPI001D09869D|nr:ester cyclase [Streptomyces pinistramenti]MCB5910064.1 ester cyclase [Streptomyces pinistramenti]